MSRATSNPLLPISSYSLSLVYAAVAGKTASQLIEAVNTQNEALALLNAGTTWVSATIATALVVSTMTDSGYTNFRDFFQDCATRLDNMQQSVTSAFASSNKPKTQNSYRPTTPQRPSYERPKSRVNYSDTNRTWETWLPKAILAVSSLALAYTFTTGLGKTVFEYGCEVGTANQSACELFGLEHNERNTPSLRNMRP